MDDEEIWQLAKKPVTEFIESIKQMELNVESLVRFYLKHLKDKSSDLPGHKKSTKSLEDDQTRQLSALARAKVELAIVFSMNTCYWMHLVTNGEDPSKNEISKDIERVRLFMKRAKEVEESVTGNNSSAKRPKIDKEASKRLCLNNISLKSRWD